MEDWAEIRRLHRAEGMPVRAIARRLAMSRNTVRRALASDRPPRYVRPLKGCIVDEPSRGTGGLIVRSSVTTATP